MKELLNFLDLGGETVGGKTVKKQLPVFQSRNPIIQERQHAAVGLAANQASKSLFEGQGSLRNLVVVERIAPILANRVHARRHHRVSGNRERQAINDDATQLLTLHVDPLPETGSR